MLLVNGSPKAEIDADEVGLLAASIDPLDDSLGGPARFTPFHSQVVEPYALGTSEVDLGAYDVIWLANVAGLGPRAITELEERVAAGCALIVSAGDQLAGSRDQYNERLWRPDGSGLLPAELGGRLGRHLPPRLLLPRTGLRGGPPGARLLRRTSAGSRS